jgi:hypothetical protein
MEPYQPFGNVRFPPPATLQSFGTLVTVLPGAACTLTAPKLIDLFKDIPRPPPPNKLYSLTDLSPRETQHQTDLRLEGK